MLSIDKLGTNRDFVKLDLLGYSVLKLLGRDINIGRKLQISGASLLIFSHQACFTAAL